MILAGINDEATQYIVFKVKAGQKLLEVYKATESSSEAPSQETHPFSNAQFRLKTYFASTSDVMLQRRKLVLMSQKPTESDLAFIRRVGLAASQCEYSEGKQLEEILSTVAEQAKHKEVRIAALKMMSRKASLADLVDKVREIETIRLNEEYVSKKQVTTATSVASVNAVRTLAGPSHYDTSHSSPGYGKAPNQRTNFRGGRGQRPFRGGISWRGSSSQIPERCTRCNSVYHSAERCFAIEMTCHNCGGKGHLLRACKLPLTPRTSHHSDSRKPGSTSLEVAAISAKPEATHDEDNDERAVLKSLNVSSETALTVTSEETDGVIMARVAGMTCELLIDSGAQVNTVTESVFELLVANDQYSQGLYNVQQGTDRPLKAYAASNGIQVLCNFEAFLHISDDRPVLLEKFYVVKELRSLLSRATAIRYSVLLLGLKVPISSASADSSTPWQNIASITSEEPFPKFNIPAIKIRYDSSKPPCRNIFMNVPVAMKHVVGQRLEELTTAGIIERVTD